MARGRKTALTIRLTPLERLTLLRWQRSRTIAAGVARRAQIVLLRAGGMTITDITATVGMSRRHVTKWVQRYLHAGLPGLASTPRPGRRRRSQQDSAMDEQHRVASV